MGAQISTNLSSGCSSMEQRYLDIKSKANLGRYIKCANKSTLMVINFTTTWCQPCKDAEQPMRKLAEDFQNVKFARVDIDLLQDVVKEFDLETMPTFLLCKIVDDGLDKGKGAAEVGGGNGSGNRIAGDTKVNSIPKAKQDDGLESVTEVKSATNVEESSATGVKERNSVTASATQEKSATSVKEGNSVVPSAIEGKRTTGMKEGNSVVPSATQGKRTTSIKEGNNVVSSASEGKSATSVKEGNRAAAGATGGKSGTGVERANSSAISGSKGESTTANAKEGQRMALAPEGENATSTVEEGNSVSSKTNSMKNGDGVTGIKESSPKRRTVNYEGKKVSIDEIDRRTVNYAGKVFIDRMKGPFEELRRKIVSLGGVEKKD